MEKTMRAKLRITQVKKDSETQETLIFRAVGRNDSYPENGFDENNTFAHFTPSAELTLTIANPNLLNCFHDGEEFYVDFFRAPVVNIPPTAEQKKPHPELDIPAKERGVVEQQGATGGYKPDVLKNDPSRKSDADAKKARAEEAQTEKEETIRREAQKHNPSSDHGKGAAKATEPAKAKGTGLRDSKGNG